MPEIIKNFTFDDLLVKPPFGGKLRLSEDIQQTIASIIAWDGQTRRLIRSSPNGVLRVCDGRAKAVLNVTATGAAYTLTPDDIPTSEVIVKAHVDNVGQVVVNIGVTASLVAGFPLDPGESVSLSVNNLNALRLYVELTTEKAAILYTE